MVFSMEILSSAVTDTEPAEMNVPFPIFAAVPFSPVVSGAFIVNFSPSFSLMPESAPLS